MTSRAPSDHGERDGGLATELQGDRCEIRRAQFAVLDAGASVRQPLDVPGAPSAASIVNIVTTAKAVVVVKILTRTSGWIATLLVTD
jgi:hypothetical protein